MFDDMSCLEIADVSSNRKFISHKAVTLVIDQIWNGIVNPDVAVLRVKHIIIILYLLFW